MNYYQNWLLSEIYDVHIKKKDIDFIARISMRLKKEQVFSWSVVQKKTE